MFKKKKDKRPDEIAAFVFAADAQEALEKLKQKYRLTPDSFGGFAACFPKPKFNIDEWQGKYGMYFETQDDLLKFYDYLHSVGRTWFTRASYKDFRPVVDGIHRRVRYLYFNNGTCSYENDPFYKIINFKDFDWSDFNMKETFTKADLKPGMVVEVRDGARYLFVNELFVSSGGYLQFISYNDDLTHAIYDCLDVVKIFNTRGTEFGNILHDHHIDLIWERKEVKEMTVKEIEEQLGYKVKIVDGE